MGDRPDFNTLAFAPEVTLGYLYLQAEVAAC